MYHHHNHNHHWFKSNNKKQHKSTAANNVTVEKTQERTLFELNEDEFMEVIDKRISKQVDELRHEMEEARAKFFGESEQEENTVADQNAIDHDEVERLYQESIERARRLGVEEEHILDTHEKIDAYFHNTK